MWNRFSHVLQGLIFLLSLNRVSEVIVKKGVHVGEVECLWPCLMYTILQDILSA